MGSGMPEIGSRISLISKADIRYEGKLFAVDPEECTIALSSVRSYGTEDRKTTYPVPAQNQVYDFILFRGSDIKDIRVLTATIPNDPAIVQLSVPPSLSNADSQFETADGEFRISGAAGSPAGTSRMPNAPSLSSRPTQTFQNSGIKPLSVFANIDQVVGAGKHIAPHNVLSEDDSRSSTPSALNAKNSTDAPAAARNSLSSSKSDEHQSQSHQQLQQQRKQQTYGNRDTNRSQQQHYHQQQNNRYQQGAGGRQYQQQRYQQNRYPQQQHYQQRYQQQQQSQYRDYNNRENNQSYRNYNNDFRGDGGYNNQRQYMQPLRGNVQRGGGDTWNHNNSNSTSNSYGQRRMNRPGQFGGGMNQQLNNSYQSAGGYQNRLMNRKPRSTLKFEDDYDFEQANSQFEEMRSQLAKTKIDEGGDGPQLNGDGGDAVEASKEKDEVSGGEENAELDGADAKAQCYDKVKSFFDQISYEAIERSKGLTQRMDWKTERKINSETFGQVALRNNSNYRGRMNNMGGGYYSNYHHNNRNSGGMHNNYRTGGGGYNLKSQNNNNNNNPRRQYNNVTSNTEEGKENQIVVA